MMTTMTPAEQVITGAESPAGDGSAHDALIDFYRAFNARDIVSLACNWAAADMPSMNNPIGGIRRGWQSIHDGYQKLFDGPARVRVEFFDFTSQGVENCYLFVGRERGVCVTPTGRVELRIRTTRWFVRLDGKWRQLHHHGSIEEPAMLADYQRAIFGYELCHAA